MTRVRPEQEWWTPGALAEAGLPDVPATRQGVDAFAARNDWRAHPDLARKRAGRGGGWEYHWMLLPSRAQRRLLREAVYEAPAAASRPARDEVWTYFDGLPEAVKEIARKRLAVLARADALSPAMGRDAAVSTIAAEEAVSARTIWNWLALVDGVDPADRLAYLAPRNRAATRQAGPAACDVEFLDYLKAAYLRVARPSFTASYDATVKICRARGWSYLTTRTARRWIDQNVPRVQRIYAREGEAGLARCFPPQIRDRSMLRAGEAVCADCHKIDIFVEWPGFDKPVRPQIVAFQDLYSNKILAWRVDLSPNKVAVMAAFSDLIGQVGIPTDVLFDNGREFANFWMTGGAPTRFRFRQRDDTPLGIIPLLGCKVHWATPGHGQAKPVERGFRDFADRIAKDPRFAGAYVGHKPDAKPEDYGTLVKVLARAFRWKRMLETSEFATIAELAERERIAPSYMTRVLRLTLIAPDIVEVMLDGKQGPVVTLARLMEPLPVGWDEQRSLLARA